MDKVEVDRGSVVKEGQLLATMIAPELNAQRAEAKAKVSAAESQKVEAEARVLAVQSTYERMKAAAATPGVIAGNELIQAEKQVDVERAKVAAAKSSIQVNVIQATRPGPCHFNTKRVVVYVKINLRASPSGILLNPALFVKIGFRAWFQACSRQLLETRFADVRIALDAPASHDPCIWSGLRDIPRCAAARTLNLLTNRHPV